VWIKLAEDSWLKYECGTYYMPVRAEIFYLWSFWFYAIEASIKIMPRVEL